MTEVADGLWPDQAGWPMLLAFEARGDGVREWHLALEPGLLWLQGHFPDNPVLPGIAQLHWAISLGQRHWPGLHDVCKVENLKFRRPVQPPATLVLTLWRDAGQPRLRFEYRVNKALCSSGRVYFT